MWHWYVQSTAFMRRAAYGPVRVKKHRKHKRPDGLGAELKQAQKCDGHPISINWGQPPRMADLKGHKPFAVLGDGTVVYRLPENLLANFSSNPRLLVNEREFEGPTVMAFKLTRAAPTKPLDADEVRTELERQLMHWAFDDCPRRDRRVLFVDLWGGKRTGLAAVTRRLRE